MNHYSDGHNVGRGMVAAYDTPEEHELLDRVRKLYNELLYAVARKYPGETRHQTALRYIQQAERGNTQEDARTSTSCSRLDHGTVRYSTCIRVK